MSIEKHYNKKKFQNVEPKFFYTGTKLFTKFQIKGRRKGEHRHCAFINNLWISRIICIIYLLKLLVKLKVILTIFNRCISKATLADNGVLISCKY